MDNLHVQLSRFVYKQLFHLQLRLLLLDTSANSIFGLSKVYLSLDPSLYSPAFFAHSKLSYFTKKSWGVETGNEARFISQ